jgi:hypothetical protein
VGLLLNYFDKLLDQPQWLDTHVARIQRDNHAVTTIDVYSLSTVPVEQYFNGTSLGTATAFIWERKEAFYLITNWHVVTCRDHTEGKHLHTHAGEPNTLRALLNPREQRFGKHVRDLPIRDPANKPRWLIHPYHKVDVVAIPLQPPDQEIRFLPINKLGQDPLDIQIGMDVFVLGYPFGAPPPSLPVWKRGSIASEPELARLGHNYFLIDSASRPGMSGAPVIRRSWGSHMLETGTLETLGSATKIVGVNSGRLATKDPLDAQLGVVWPESFITEIIDNGVYDTGA